MAENQPPFSLVCPASTVATQDSWSAVDRDLVEIPGIDRAKTPSTTSVNMYCILSGNYKTCLALGDLSSRHLMRVERLSPDSPAQIGFASRKSCCFLKVSEADDDKKLTRA